MVGPLYQMDVTETIDQEIKPQVWATEVNILQPASVRVHCPMPKSERGSPKGLLFHDTVARFMCVDGGSSTTTTSKFPKLFIRLKNLRGKDLPGLTVCGEGRNQDLHNLAN